MHSKIEEIKRLESKPRIIKNLFDKNQIEKFLELYERLPITVNNKKRRGILLLKLNIFIEINYNPKF